MRGPRRHHESHHRTQFPHDKSQHHVSFERHNPHNECHQQYDRPHDVPDEYDQFHDEPDHQPDEFDHPDVLHAHASPRTRFVLPV